MANVKIYYAPKDQHFTIHYDPDHGMVARGMRVAEEEEDLRRNRVAEIGDLPIKMICDDGYLIVIDDQGPIVPNSTPQRAETRKSTQKPVKDRKRTVR